MFSHPSISFFMPSRSEDRDIERSSFSPPPRCYFRWQRGFRFPELRAPPLAVATACRTTICKQKTWRTDRLTSNKHSLRSFARERTCARNCQCRVAPRLRNVARSTTSSGRHSDRRRIARSHKSNKSPRCAKISINSRSNSGSGPKMYAVAREAPNLSETRRSRINPATRRASPPSHRSNNNSSEHWLKPNACSSRCENRKLPATSRKSAWMMRPKRFRTVSKN